MGPGMERMIVCCLFFSALLSGPMSAAVCLQRWTRNVDNRSPGLQRLANRDSDVRAGIPGVFELHGVKFSPCWVQKCGSFNFYELFRILGSRKVSQSEAQRKLLLQNEVPRFMVVRNPYARLISAFLDKFSGRVERFKEGNYSDFVDYVWDKWNNCGKTFKCFRAEADRHLRPQVDYCNQQYGFQLDFVLKLEESHMWLPELLSHLQVPEEQQQSSLPKALLGVRLTAGCPISDNIQSSACRSYFRDRACHSLSQPTGRLLQHKPRDSNSKLHRFYVDTERIWKVSEMYYGDFIEYGYPFWGESLHV